MSMFLCLSFIRDDGPAVSESSEHIHYTRLFTHSSLSVFYIRDDGSALYESSKHIHDTPLIHALVLVSLFHTRRWVGSTETKHTHIHSVCNKYTHKLNHMVAKVFRRQIYTERHADTYTHKKNNTNNHINPHCHRSSSNSYCVRHSA